MRKFPPSVSRSHTSESSAAVVPRRFARAAVDLPAQYAVEGRPGWHTSTIDNLGGGGVRLQTEEDVAAGTVVRLRFDVEGTPISATALVAMSLFDKSRERFIHGVAFTAIDPHEQETIVKRVIALQHTDEL
jgi:hypothetical protein